MFLTVSNTQELNQRLISWRNNRKFLDSHFVLKVFIPDLNSPYRLVCSADASYDITTLFKLKKCSTETMANEEKKRKIFCIENSRKALHHKIADGFACNTWLVTVVTVIILIQHILLKPLLSIWFQLWPNIYLFIRQRERELFSKLNPAFYGKRHERTNSIWLVNNAIALLEACEAVGVPCTRIYKFLAKCGFITSKGNL